MSATPGRTGLEPFWLDTGRGARFCLLHTPPPGCAAESCLVYLHPFAEEMNKSRRTAALAARAFARAGRAVLQVDLAGCGDSDGELADVAWADWLADGRLAVACMRDRYRLPVGLWGLRLGGLLACDLARTDSGVDGPMLLWSPVTSGRTFLTQFLRIAVAGAAFGRQDAATSTGALAARLAAGETVEVGGYPIAPTLAADLGQLALAACRPDAGPIVWCEPGASEPPVLSPAARAVIATWREAGSEVREVPVKGESFWATLEIAEAHALIAASVAALGAEVVA